MGKIARIVEKAPRPVTTCTDCRTPGHSLAQVGRQCSRFFIYASSGRKWCNGSIQAAIGEKDWGECPNCAATGYKDSKRCDQCEGAGWIFIRDQRNWP